MQRRGIILYNISIYHVYQEEGHRPSAKSMPEHGVFLCNIRISDRIILKLFELQLMAQLINNK